MVIHLVTSFLALASAFLLLRHTLDIRSKKQETVELLAKDKTGDVYENIRIEEMKFVMLWLITLSLALLLILLILTQSG
jgi:hypothetical protein